jgi:hypothetical protein
MIPRQSGGWIFCMGNSTSDITSWNIGVFGSFEYGKKILLSDFYSPLTEGEIILTDVNMQVNIPL